MIIIQMLHSSHCFVWLPAMVLQTHPFVVPSQSSWQNAKKGSHIDFWSIQNLLMEGIEAIVGFIPIKSHLQKLGGRL